MFDFVTDTDECGNENIYTVMDFIPGKSLDEWLKEGRKFTYTQVAKYLKQLCEVVDYLHSQATPIIHGDIKPANIMLTPEDNICLIDFNISGFSDNMEVIGFTPGYASPEQVQAAQDRSQRKIEISERSDIFSIGAAMYPLITGYKPNPIYEKQISIEKSGIEVSEGMAFIIDKSMQLDPKARFQSAGEMLNAINALGKKDKRYKKLIQKQIAVIVFFIMLTGACIICSYIGYGKMQSDKGIAHYEYALELYNNKDYNGALRYILQDALENESLYDKGMLGNLYYLAAECSFETEEYVAAADFYEQSLIYLDSPEAYCNYAIALSRLGKTDQALEVIDQALEVIDQAVNKGIDSDQIFLMKGELSIAQKDEKGAVENLTSCIETTQEPYILTRAYVMYSDLYVKKEDYTLNEQWIEENINLLTSAKTVVSKEYLPIVLERLMNAYCAMGDLTADMTYYENAILTCKEIIESGGGIFEIYMNMALLYSEVGQYEESYATYQGVLEKYGDNYIVYKRLAFLEIDIQTQVENTEKDYQKFVEYYNRCMELFEFTDKKKDEDMEMELLENTYETLSIGGWI